MESLREIVCKNFNRVVEASPLTKREIARLTGVSEATIQRWKAGINSPETGHIESLASVLKISPLEFYSVEEKPPVLYAPMSSMVKKMLAIPDDIYEDAEKIDLDDDAWDTVRSALKIAIEMKEMKKKNKA